MSNTVMPTSGQSKQIIPLVEMEDHGVQAVMGRDFHAFLEIKEPYTDWFPRMVEYGFSAGQDFIQKNLIGQDKLGRRRETVNHVVSLDMAKEIAMIQRTDKGREARRYFIECERRYREANGTTQSVVDPSTLSRMDILRMAIDSEEKRLQLEAHNRQLTKQAEQNQPKVCYFDNFVADEDLIQFRTLATQCGLTEKRLRETLIHHRWIYRITGRRWSNKKARVVPVHQYRPMADKKHYFALVPCHEAPRIGGEVQQTLKLTPQGAEAVHRMLTRWGETRQLKLVDGGVA